MFKLLKIIIPFVGAATSSALLADANVLIDSNQVLRELSTNEVGVDNVDGDPTSLLRAVRDFERTDDARTPQDIAREWVQLLARSVGENTQSMPSMDTFDANTMSSVSSASLIAALPAPQHWPAITKLIESGEETNALTQSQQLAIQLIAQALRGDASAQHRVVTKMEQALKAEGDFEDVLDQSFINDLLTRLAVASGDKKTTIASIRRQYRHDGEYPIDVELPDLVTLYGESVARELLTEGLHSQKITLDIEKGPKTIALAQAIALAEVDALKGPQWGLVQNLDALALYEAMDERFGSMGSNFDYKRHQARLVYLFGLIASGDATKASSVAGKMESDFDWHVSRDLLRELDNAGYTQEVAEFLRDFLKTHIDSPLWEVYTRLAAATGHEVVALELIEAGIEQATSAAMRETLADYRLDILLSIDRLPEALAILRERVADGSNEERLESAVRYAKVSELIGASQELEEAVAVALPEAAKRIKKASNGGYAHDLEPVFDLIKLLRETGSGREAQNLALKIVHSQKPDTSSVGSFSMSSGDFQNAGVELVGLYADAEQYEDLVRFVNGFAYWGSDDVAGLLDQKDSHGDYVAFLIAKALAETGNPEQAIRILEALMLAAGGYDPAYQLYTEILGARALPFLSKRSKLDRFQERPLVWAAAVHYQQGEYEIAKSTVQKAIAIDPSDGEQGPGHRMRAYAILADVMAALNQPEEAEKFHNAVAAIRLSEQADRFRDLNMHAKALEMYQEAADQFQYAYCIQSRLAISLSDRGQHAQAAAHYRRAYELMPSSFGRVESHCFGCQNVFSNNNAQGIAEAVFTDMIAATPNNPQVHYMLAYLRVKQGLFDDAITLVRKAVALDPEYLNAWKLLFKIGKQVQLPAFEHDIAAIRMLELDPLRRHVQVNLSSITDLKSLWNVTADAIEWTKSFPTTVYPLAETRRFQEKQMSALPEEFKFMLQMQRQMLNRKRAVAPGVALLHNTAIRAALGALGVPVMQGSL